MLTPVQVFDRVLRHQIRPQDAFAAILLDQVEIGDRRLLLVDPDTKRLGAREVGTRRPDRARQTLLKMAMGITEPVLAE